MFNSPNYITKGAEAALPPWLIRLLWSMVCSMEPEQQNCLQIFYLSRTETGQHIIHEQEQPPYRMELDVPYGDAVTAKVYVIDDRIRCTMLLADEY